MARLYSSGGFKIYAIFQINSWGGLLGARCAIFSDGRPYYPGVAGPIFQPCSRVIPHGLLNCDWSVDIVWLADIRGDELACDAWHCIYSVRNLCVAIIQDSRLSRTYADGKPRMDTNGHESEAGLKFNQPFFGSQKGDPLVKPSALVRRR